MQYEVHTLSKDIYHVTLHIGFRVEPRVDLFFRNIVKKLIASGELSYEKTEEKKYDQSDMGDYRFIVANSFLSYYNELSFWKNLLIKCYYNLKAIGVKEHVNYGIDASNVIFEKYPLVYNQTDHVDLERIHKDSTNN